MTKNAKLNKAKDAKNDEFYTQREDIERELSHYKEFFKDKIVYCNCDDPVESEFWKFFVRVFKDWGIKKLMATHYEPDEQNYAYKLEISEDTNGDGLINELDEPTITRIMCNGDFRNQICIEFLKEADIVVTNPPFSLIREYILQLVEYDKSFLIIAPLNSLKYRDIFALIQSKRMWVGYTYPKMFRVPPDAEDTNITIVDGVKYKKFGNIQWVTNLDIPKVHSMLDLRGNYYTPEKYPKLANYDAIEVPKVNDIPCDYDGVMAVPISFYNLFNPDQFELLGRTGEIDWATSPECTFFTPPSEEQAKIFKAQNRTWRIQNGYHVDENGIAHTVYDRLFIRNRNPEPRRYQ